MPRTARAAVGGYCYHVLNRGNRRARVFHGDGDYAAFCRLMRQATARVPLRVLGYCLMPNHVHLVLWPAGDDDLAAWMHWLFTTQVRRHNLRHSVSGHVWQGRFRAFPIQEDDHLLAVLRYVERNPLRAGLVGRAEDWPWSSLRERLLPAALPWLHPGPVALPPGWPALVEEPQTEAEREALRRCAHRGTPFGDDAWVRRTAAALGLESTLRPPGRPPKGSPPPPAADEPSLFG
jgi:putative transposase